MGGILCKGLINTGSQIEGDNFMSHFQQVQDKAVMRAGVERDKERILAKKKQREMKDIDADNTHGKGEGPTR
eukprot:CCRYP_000159-RA/>CCRYP_000159-RA protein AED:0.48 eAED:0.77 QI:45/0/0.5/1/0/0/2/0/71